MNKSMTIFVYKDCGANQINHMNISQNVFHGLSYKSPKRNFPGRIK